MFVNVGASYKNSGQDIPTKKALKDALAHTPANVNLYSTSAFGNSEGAIGSELVEGVKYTVTGPNPFTNRKWYATVTKTGDKVTVK